MYFLCRLKLEIKELDRIGIVIRFQRHSLDFWFLKCFEVPETLEIVIESVLYL